MRRKEGGYSNGTVRDSRAEAERGWVLLRHYVRSKDEGLVSVCMCHFAEHDLGETCHDTARKRGKGRRRSGSRM